MSRNSASVKRLFADLHGQVHEITVQNSRQLSWYYNQILRLDSQAKIFLKSGDLERAYVTLLQMLHVSVAVVPKHNAYSSKLYSREKIQNTRRSTERMGAVELLKKQITKQHLNPPKPQVVAIPTPTTTTTTHAPQREDGNDAPLEDVVAVVSKAPRDWSNLSFGKSQRQGEGKRTPGNTSTTRTAQPYARSGQRKRSYPDIQNPNNPSSRPTRPQANTTTTTTTTTSSTASVVASTYSTDEQGQLHVKPLHVFSDLMERFLTFAQPNTTRGIETCGMLCGRLEASPSRFTITHVILPKQRGTPNTTTTEHEEELIEIQESKGLISLGWIHTHPTQDCFLSSVDLHTQVTHQLMMPEAIAIVMSPQRTPNFGIFSLRPSAIPVLTSCNSTGFHPHDNKVSGSLYDFAHHVQIEQGPSTTFIDLRNP